MAIQTDTETFTYGTCPTCKNHGTIACRHINTGRNEFDWCADCDCPPDDEPGWITCPTCENW